MLLNQTRMFITVMSNVKINIAIKKRNKTQSFFTDKITFNVHLMQN